MIWLAAGFAVLAILLLAGQYSANADVNKLANQIRFAGGLASLGLSAFFIVTGRVLPGLVLGGAGLALLARRRQRQQPGPRPGPQAGRGGQSTGQKSPPPGPQHEQISRAEALHLLGLHDPFTSDEVRQAHRKLMMQHHPDQGGDTKLAARLNAAKARLLGEE